MEKISTIITFSRTDTRYPTKRFVFGMSMLLVVVIFATHAGTALAQTSLTSSYVPLIGITVVPDQLTVAHGPSMVTYNYAVKSLLPEVPLRNVSVVDTSCSPVLFVGGDDNGNSILDINETWRYRCSTSVANTTNSTATATGTGNGVTVSHSANATVVVGSTTPPPLISIVNTTRVLTNLVSPATGNNITFMYKVTNPGVVSLGGVRVTADNCSPMSGQLGDTNGNGLLDPDEVWIYTCDTRITQDTTNTATVVGYESGMKATDSTAIAITVDPKTATLEATPLFDVASNPIGSAQSNGKIITWATLSGILAALILFFVFSRKQRLEKKRNDAAKLRKK